MKKWVLLEHKVFCGDLFDIHFDFLLENGSDCLTWKILEVPSFKNGSVQIIKQPNHRLVWLSRLNYELSDNRGFVRRIDFGNLERKDYKLNFEEINLRLKGKLLNGIFQIKGNSCRLINNI